MIIGTGIDIVKMERIERLFGSFGDKFLQKILSDEEAGNVPVKFPAPYISGRFAVKEALVKAMGGKEFSFGDITVLNDDKGRPFIKDARVLAGLLGIPEQSFAIHISISHEQDHCVASVIIESRP
jgi:holo-[acyl-carrier protein] synthase